MKVLGSYNGEPSIFLLPTYSRNTYLPSEKVSLAMKKEIIQNLSIFFIVCQYRLY